MVAVNPVPEEGLMNFVDPNAKQGNPLSVLGFGRAYLAVLYLPVERGSYTAVLQGVRKIMLEEERRSSGSVLDRDFVESRTEGLDVFLESLDTTSWDDIFESSGLSREQVDEAAGMIMAADRFITCWAMGVTQHTDAV